jgi:hypothetical protein
LLKKLNINQKIEIMKKLILLAVGAVLVQQAAKYFNIKSVEDLKASLADLKDLLLPKLSMN